IRDRKVTGVQTCALQIFMNTKSRESRFEETAKLLDYGFDNFKREEIFPAGYQLSDESTLPVAKGKKDTVDIATEQEFSTLIKEEDKENYSIKYHLDKDKVNKDGKLTAPIKEGEKVGTA